MTHFSENEHESIRARDRRLQAITTLAAPHRTPDGQLHPIGTALESVGFIKHGARLFDVPLPSPPALYLELATSLELKARAHLRATFRGVSRRPLKRPVALRRREKRFLDALQARAATIILSHTALEAFANESIPDGYQVTTQDHAGQSVVRDRDYVERRFSLEDKLDLVLPQILGCPSPKGTALWQGLAWLARFRDRLIHLKPRDWRGKGPAEYGDWIWNQVIQPTANRSPWYARDLIAYFAPSPAPRWLHKYTKANTRHFSKRIA